LILTSSLVGCNTFSTALLIGEKCAVLSAEDLGYSGSALDMKVPNYTVSFISPIPCSINDKLTYLPGTDGESHWRYQRCCSSVNIYE
jgi:hypothetical protein